MAEMEVLNKPAQTEIVVIPMIDVSGSMAGASIGSVNDAMREVPEQLKDINCSYAIFDGRKMVFIGQRQTRRSRYV